ncbi:MAG: hypothetical protein WBV46_15705, partial [Terriglobales bacterium]
VQDDHVGFQSLRFVDRFGAVAGFAADLETRMGIQNVPHAFSDKRMIIRHENSQASIMQRLRACAQIAGGHKIKIRRWNAAGPYSANRIS